MGKNRFGLRLLVALLCAAGGVRALLAIEPAVKETPPPAESSNSTQEEPQAQEEEAAVTEPGEPKTAQGEAAAGAKAPKRFVPTDRSTADNSATFPVDI